MDSFVIDEANGALTKCVTARSKSKDNDEAVLTNDVHVVVEVSKKSSKAVECLFPGYRFMAEAIGEYDGDHAGVKIHAKGSLPALNVTIFDQNGELVFTFDRVSLNGQPVLSINGSCESTLSIRLDARMSKKDMSKLVDFVDAEIFVSAVISQPNLPGFTVGVDAEKNEEDSSMTPEELKALREGNNMSADDMVDHLSGYDLHVSQTSVLKWEDGSASIPLAIANTIRSSM
jgi:DNA-binding transcriptional regulator YiaG